MIKRITSTVAAALLVVAAAVFGLQSPALAVGVEMDGPNGSSGYYVVDYAQDAIVILVRSGNLAPGECATAYLDIARAYGVGKPGGHYDARGSRTCKPNSSRTSSWQYEGATYGIQITSIQKAGVCSGDWRNVTSACQNKVGSVSSIGPVSDSNNMCTRFWTENSTGSKFYFGAGDPGDCNN
jgi:hypothetical protein